MKTQIKSLILAAVIGLFGAVTQAQEAGISAPTDVTIKSIGLNADGSLVGKISTAISSFDAATPAEKLSVSISRSGKIIGESKTDENGRFEIKNVGTGRYNLLAHGDQALLATGVEVTAADDKSTEFEFVAMPAPLKVATTILSQYSKQFAESKPLKDTKVKLVSVQVISPTTSEGTVNGRVSNLNGELANIANVLLIQGNNVVANVEVNNGAYSFSAVKPGVYTVMAIADSGFSVFGLEVVASATVSNVSFRDNPIDITLVAGQTQDILPSEEAGLVLDAGFGAPCCGVPVDSCCGAAGGGLAGGGFGGGGFGGGGFGGGGFGGGGIGGGGGLGLAIGATGLALGAAALGNNDNRASPF